MNKLRYLFERVVKRLAEMGSARKQDWRRELMPVERRSDGEPRESLKLESVVERTDGEQRAPTELVTAEGHYDGERRQLTKFIAAERRYRGGPQSDLNLAHEETPEYVVYWRAIMLRKWSILALVLLVTAIASVAVSRMVPVYRSSTTLLIATDTTKLVPIGDASSGIGAYYREYFQTQAEVLKSRDVAQRVVTKLKLAAYPEFAPVQSEPSALATWVGEHFPELKALLWKSPQVLDDASVEAAVLQRYAERLTIEPVRQTQLIKVSFEAHDAALAAAVANATAQAYIQADLDTRSAINQDTGQQINERLEGLKAKLNASEKALQTYRDREGMLDNKSTVLGGVARQLDALTQKLVDARVRLSEAEQAYNQVKAGEATNYESVPAVVKSSSVQRAKEVEAEAEKKLAEVSQRYGSEHPKFLAASQRPERRARQHTTADSESGRKRRQGIRGGSGHGEDYSGGAGAIEGQHPEPEPKGNPTGHARARSCSEPSALPGLPVPLQGNQRHRKCPGIQCARR